VQYPTTPESTVIRQLTALTAVLAVASAGRTYVRPIQKVRCEPATWAWGARDTVSRLRARPRRANGSLHAKVRDSSSTRLAAKDGKKSTIRQAQVIVTYHYRDQADHRAPGRRPQWAAAGMVATAGACTAHPVLLDEHQTVDYTTGGLLVIVARPGTSLAWKGCTKRTSQALTNHLDNGPKAVEYVLGDPNEDLTALAGRLLLSSSWCLWHLVGPLS